MPLKTEPYLVGIRVFEDGVILLFTPSQVYVYTKEGETVLDFPAYFNGGIVLLEEHRIIAKTNNASAYVVIDLTAGKVLEEYLGTEMLYGTISNFNTLLEEAENRQLLVTGGGIYEKQEQEWRLAVPSAKTSIYKSDFTPCRVWAEGEKYFITDEEFLYCYSPAVASAKEEVKLKVFSLCESTYIKDTIVNYQIAHPEITVEYSFAQQQMPDSVQEMNTVWQRVNTEIVEPYQENSGYFYSVLNGYETANGLFAVPLYFRADFILCKKELSPFVQNINSLGEYLKENPEEKGLTPFYYRNNISGFYLPMLYHFYSQDLYDNGTITKDRIQRFLEAAGVIYERMEENTEADLSSYGEKYDIFDFNDYYIADEMWQLFGKKAGSLSLYVYGEGSVAVCTPLPSHYDGFEMLPTGRFHPVLLLGMHTQSPNKEAAGELVDYLIESTKDYNIRNNKQRNRIGIPVYKDSLAVWMENYKNQCESSYTITDGYYLNPAYGEAFPLYLPEEKDAPRLIKQLEQFNTPAASADEKTDPVYTVFKEGAKGFFEGEKSADEAADEIYRGILRVQSEME